MAIKIQETERTYSKLIAAYDIERGHEVDPLKEGFSHENTRLNKFLSSRGVCSRRAADKLIVAGRVTVNGKVIRQLGTNVDTVHDIVAVDGEQVREQLDSRIIVFNKPAGVLCTCKAGKEQGPILLEYLPNDRRYFPVGRLDRDSSGLLIVTDNGQLAHRLSHPRFGSTKVYRIIVSPPLLRSQAMKLAKGVMLSDGIAKAVHVRELSNKEFELTLSEGRNRQIRRMVSALGSRVVSLTRTEQSGIRLGSLRPGQWRELTDDERHRLTASISSSTT